VSQLLSLSLLTLEGPFSAEALESALSERVNETPEALFLDPELQRDPRRCVGLAVVQLLKLGIIERVDPERYRLTKKRRHPSFENVADIVAHEAELYAQAVGSANC